MHYDTFYGDDAQQRTTKIALVDDHPLFREGLAKVIEEFGNYKVMIKAGDGKDFIEQLDPENLPDIVILDLNMPVMNGYATASWLIKNHPGIRILILTMFDSESAMIGLLRLGLESFVKKNNHPDDLKYVLNTIVKLGHYRHPAIAAKAAELKNDQKSLELSAKEETFLKWVTTDLTYKEIAKEMYVSERTIENYWDSLKEKFSVKNRIGLAMCVVKSGMEDI